MENIVVCAVAAVGLFGATFSSKRRFGLLGLGLAAGSVLSDVWSSSSSVIVTILGIDKSPLTSAIVLCLIILLPSIILLFSGSTYKTTAGRLIGSILFAVLAMAFLTKPLGETLNFSGLLANIYSCFVANRGLIIGVGVSFAVVDSLSIRQTQNHSHQREH
jgi:hypothetical protein